MRLKQAVNILKDFKGLKLKELPNYKECDINNKGAVGQLLELAIGKKLDNNCLDFEDGEMKSISFTKHTITGTMPITMCRQTIEDYIEGIPMWKTHLGLKMSKMVIVKINKIGDRSNFENWVCDGLFFLDKNNKKYSDFINQVESDYKYIMNTIMDCYENNKQLHTTSGKYLQIRTKGSKTLHPLTVNGKVIGHNYYAFFIKLKGLRELDRINNL